MKNEVSITIGGFFFVFWLFIIFWGQSGWYRIDCSLHIQRACDLIAQEYEKKVAP